MVRLHRACHFAAKKPQNGFGEIVACLALGVLGKVDAVGKVAQCEQNKYGTEKWIADSGATFHMTTSDDLQRDARSSKVKVKIGNDNLIDIQSYGSLTVVFPNEARGITVRLEQVAYVPDSAFSLFLTRSCTQSRSRFRD